MIERGFVEQYSAVCQEYELDERERRLLWLDIVHQIDRVEDYLRDAETATDEQIRFACQSLKVPNFRTLAEAIRAQRKAVASAGVTYADLKQVAIAIASARL